MSDAQEGVRPWRLFVEDMIEFAHKALSYNKDVEKESFVSRSLTYDATLRSIELIGEAANNVPKEVQAEHPEIEWRLIIGVRNRIAHYYWGIDDDVIWDIVQTDIPSLLPKLERLLESCGDPTS